MQSEGKQGRRVAANQGAEGKARYVPARISGGGRRVRGKGKGGRARTAKRRGTGEVPLLRTRRLSTQNRPRQGVERLADWGEGRAGSRYLILQVAEIVSVAQDSGGLCSTLAQAWFVLA